MKSDLKINRTRKYRLGFRVVEENLLNKFLPTDFWEMTFESDVDHIELLSRLKKAVGSIIVSKNGRTKLKDLK